VLKDKDKAAENFAAGCAADYKPSCGL